MLDEIVKTFFELVRIPSPSLREKDAMNCIRNYLEKINVPFKEDSAGKKLNGNSGNLIARIGNGRPSIMFVAHVDTVEDGKKRIKPILKNGVIRSDGTTILGSDDKAGVTALLEALKEIRNRKNLPSVIAAFAVSEESAQMGAKYLGVSPEEADFAFDVDGSDRPGKFINKALGNTKFELHIYGKEAHAASAPEKGRNAIKAAGLIVSSLELGADAKGGTMNIGRISGGRAMNVIPGYALLEGEARAYDSRHLESKLAGIEKVAKKACKATRCSYVFMKNQGEAQPPFHENKDQRIIGIARRASLATGLKFELKTLRATLQSNVLAEKGFNVLGLCKGGREPHSKNESVSIAELGQAKKLIVKIIEQAAKENKMLQETEYVCLVDKNDRALGKMERGESHKKGALHRGGVVLVFNSKGEVFLARRSPKKSTFPNRIDSACSFHVLYGESYDKAAKRELMEETGIRKKPGRIGKVLANEKPDRMIMAVYRVNTDKKIKLDPLEATEGKFYPLEQADRIIKNKKTTPWLRESWRAYRKK